jgi:hypothetical protein
MIGTSQAPGIMVLTMKDLFEAIKKNENEKQYKLSISYLEVYNEQIRDLLVESNNIIFCDINIVVISCQLYFYFISYNDLFFLKLQNHWY